MQAVVIPAQYLAFKDEERTRLTKGHAYPRDILSKRDTLGRGTLFLFQRPQLVYEMTQTMRTLEFGEGIGGRRGEGMGIGCKDDRFSGLFTTLVTPYF